MGTIIRLLALLFVSISPHLLAQDTTPPVLTSINISPGSVDVSTGDQNITVTLTMTDGDSGVSFGNLFLYRPDGNFVDSIFFNHSQRTSGDDLDGTYEVTVVVPQYAAPGTWEIRMFAEDNESNRRDYGPTDTAFPTPGDENFSVVNTGTEDTTGPQLTAMSVTPDTINTGTLAQTITLDMTITDDLSGHDGTNISFFDPSNNQGSFFGFFGVAGLVSGNTLNGTYQTTVSVPQGSAEGTWTSTPFLRDRVGNTTSLFNAPGGSFVVDNAAGGPVGDLSDATDATQYSWTNSGDEDWFVQSSMTRDGIDAAQSGAISDDESSDMETTVTGPGTLSFWWKVDSEFNSDYLSVEILGTAEFEEISGDEDWAQVSLTVPAGPQTVRWSYTKDSSGNSGEDAGWVDQVKFLGSSDTESPTLQRITISPSPVDISSGDVEVTITIEATDDFNGLDSAYVCILDPNDESYNGDSLSLISGDANCGVYEVVLTIYQSDFDPVDFFELGTWRAQVELCEAVTFDTRIYGAFEDPFPIPGTELFTVADGISGGDTTAPRLTSITSILPDPVDVTSGTQNVIATFTVTDDSSGFDSGHVQLYNNSGNFVDSHFFSLSEQVSGDANNGTYAVTIPIPAFAAPGTWRLQFVLTDTAGNERHYPFDSPFPNPGDEAFVVTNTGPADTQNPVLQSITISPNAIDTSTSMQSIDVSLEVTDDLSGLRWIFLYVYDPTDTSVGSLFSAFAGAGTTNGTFMKTLDIPQGSMEGTWELGVFLRDQAGNSIRYGISGTASFPSPGDEEFTVGPLTPSTFDNFVSTYNLSGADAQPNANPDKDPFNNMLELLLGLNPNTYDTINPTIYNMVRTPTEFQLLFTIDPTLTVGTNGDFLEISDATGSPFTVTGQTGTNLSNDWANQLPAPVSGSTYRVSIPFASGTHGFTRLFFPAP